MQFFYCPELYHSSEAILNEEESRHCISVLRMRENDAIMVMDGRGGLYKCEITHAHAKKCGIRVLEVDKSPGRDYSLHIAIAPTKNADRIEWFVEKAVEFNIDEITPLICKHSERKTIHHERLERLIVSACKQSLKAWVPVLHPETQFNTFVSSVHNGKKAIASCNPEEKKLPYELFKKGEDVTILIGPEGDFSNEEIDLAIQNDFSLLSLGSSRLRTETAGLAACMAVYFVNEMK